MPISEQEKQAIEAILRSSDHQQAQYLQKKIFQIGFGVVLIVAGLLVAVASLAHLKSGLFAVCLFCCGLIYALVGAYIMERAKPMMETWALLRRIRVHQD